ncbi:coatomer subunit zeta-2 isoform X2 [Heterocephalus glaber]|uniref:Coatomer subunit zeta n=1 Tax=Heterocephalus glaber TaxID=10181 RepID=A0AAX6RDL5_HETGA|nr:coatomer subunit zeta-2 isoform X2 [Heterocephalus glaber]
MQRPEAWPRPHPGDGAAGTQARIPAPPAQAGEPSGLREPSLYTIKAVFILDNDGRRLLAKYYDDTFPSSKEQVIFEKNVFNKTSRTDSEIAFLGGMTIVYKSSMDLFLYVVGSSQENELILMSVLICLFESLSHILRRNVEKRWLLENLDGAFLVLDEIVDGGVILESDPQQVVQKVNFRVDDSGLVEQSVAQVSLLRLTLLLWSPTPGTNSSSSFGRSAEGGPGQLVLQSAKEQIKWSLLK